VPMLAEVVDAVVGVDTHRDTHEVEIASPNAVPIAVCSIRNDSTGYAQLLAWIVEHAPGPRLVVSIEGSRSYGVGLSRALTAAGLQVLESTRPAPRAAAPSVPRLLDWLATAAGVVRPGAQLMGARGGLPRPGPSHPAPGMGRRLHLRGSPVAVVHHDLDGCDRGPPAAPPGADRGCERRAGPPQQRSPPPPPRPEPAR
jgi:hypothetical protein